MNPEGKLPTGREQGMVLLREASDQDLLEAVILQVNKDFQLCGIDCEISAEESPDQVIARLGQILKALIRDDFRGFLNLLYRVDISESEISRGESRDLDAFVNEAVYRLLKREWLKVWLRNRIR